MPPCAVGALFNAFGDLVGIVRADQPPYGLAVRLDVVMRLLRGWGVAVPSNRSGADACADAPAAAATASAPARISALPTDPERWQVGVYGDTDKDSLPLFLAVRRGDVAEVRRLATRAALEPDSYSVRTPMHWAAAFGQIGVIKQLLLMGAKKNSFIYHAMPGNSPLDPSMGTPLHVAARANQVEAIKVLTAAGASLEEGVGLSNGPGAPLHVAARHGLLEAARALIAAGADVNAGRRYTDGWRNTPLAVAVAQGHIEMVKLLQGAKASLSESEPGAQSACRAPGQRKSALRRAPSARSDSLFSC